MITRNEIAIIRTKKKMSLGCLKFAYAILAEMEYNSYQDFYFTKKLYFDSINDKFLDDNDKRQFIELFDLLGYLSAETDEYLLINTK